jgi:hypothetical protein
MIMMLAIGNHVYGWWPFSKSDADKVVENVVEIQHLEDSLAYSVNRNKAYIKELKKTHSGLLSDEKMDALLKKQDYIAILNCLWTEPSLESRINWLEKKRSQWVPLLVAELAVEYLQRDPTLEVFLYSSRPLLNVAVCITDIDSQCAPPHAASASEFLNSQYKGYIRAILMAKHSPDSLRRFWKKNFFSFKENEISYYREALMSFIHPTEVIHSPQWVFMHGIEGLDFPLTDICQEEECREIRCRAAEEMFERVSEDEARFHQNPKRYIRSVFSQFSCMY